MAGDYYRVVPEELHLASPAEIYVNKEFITKPHWLPLNNVPCQVGITGEMYNNSQYPGSEYSNSYIQYQDYNSGYGYQGYGYESSQPVPQGDAYTQNNWTPVPQTYNAPPQPPPPEEEPKIDAVAQEMQQQKAQLTKQREDYVSKALVLRRELDQLRHQKHDLVSDGRSERDLKMVLKENDRLQDEIQGKLKAILNVIEMLSSIIKDGKKVSDLEAELEAEKMRSPSPKEQFIPREDSLRSQTPSTHEESRDPRTQQDDDKRFSYVYYDTGLHWCRACDKFPETAKGLLQHLHSKEHQDLAKENEIDTTPWHKLPTEPLLPSYDNAPKKRIPIKGLQFFISAPSWYCKLCDIWIGDLHCASHHLKSQSHFQNYENFVEQNPHWEMEWVKDREKAMARNGKPENSSDSEDDHKKKKRKHRASVESMLREKKKKKRAKRKKKQLSESSSSSSSSDSSSDDDKADNSRSIRVAMRNMSQVKSIINEDMSKWNVLEKLLDEHRKKEAAKEKPKEAEDELINQWMTVVQPVEKEKSMLDSLKDRMRAKQEMEKAKMLELERRHKEKEREEQEMLERRQRQLREEAERAERERQRREQEEFQRITDKDRNHVRFRTARENFRKRRSLSDNEEEEKKHQTKPFSPPRRNRKESERSNKSRSPPERKEEPPSKKKPPGPPSYKKLPFIGRMPLFKNRKNVDEKPVKDKELKKEDYEPQRKTRFETGNLARAFIPRPDVVCFPMLSSIPPISAPPAPTMELAPQLPPQPPAAPEPPSISVKLEPAPPPPPMINKMSEVPNNGNAMNPNHVSEENLYSEHGPEMDPNAMGQYYQDYSNMIYQQQQYQYQEEGLPHPPLEPPPLPPDDDLAMLGICADDMAAQSF